MLLPIDLPCWRRISGHALMRIQHIKCNHFCIPSEIIQPGRVETSIFCVVDTRKTICSSLLQQSRLVLSITVIHVIGPTYITSTYSSRPTNEAVGT